MALNLLGLLCVSVFYFLTVIFGFCAFRCIRKLRSNAEARLSRSKSNTTEIQTFHHSESHDTVAHAERPWEVTSPLRGDSAESLSDEEVEEPPLCRDFFIANGNIGWVIGSTSLLASRTGGLMPNATAQEAYDGGLIWCLYPMSWLISLAVSFIFYSSAPKSCNITLTDWFQKTYGRRTGALFSLPVILAELLMASFVMSYAVYAMERALGVNPWIGSIISALTISMCLCSSGLYASIVSDGLQLLLLWIALWSLFGHSNKLPVTNGMRPKITGLVNADEIGHFVDYLMVLTVGAVPLQSNFQRMAPMLGKGNNLKIFVTLVCGTVGSCAPAIFMGIKAATLDWTNETTSSELSDNNRGLIPQLLLIKAIHSEAISVLLVGLLSAGLMAACDSNVFAAATAFSHNIIKGWMKPEACEKDVMLAARVCLFVFPLLISLPAVFRLPLHHCWILPFDLLAVTIFPQLFCVHYLRPVNTYGAAAGFTMSLILRVLLGDSQLRLPPLLKLPYGDPEKGPLLPFRTTCMLVNLTVTIVVSAAYQWLFQHRQVSSVHDIFLCFMANQPVKNVKESPERVQKITVI